MCRCVSDVGRFDLCFNSMGPKVGKQTGSVSQCRLIPLAMKAHLNEKLTVGRAAIVIASCPYEHHAPAEPWSILRAQWSALLGASSRPVKAAPSSVRRGEPMSTSAEARLCSRTAMQQ